MRIGRTRCLSPDGGAGTGGAGTDPGNGNGNADPGKTDPSNTDPGDGGKTITLDDVKRFLTEGEGKNWLQSEKDSHFTKSLNTWKTNNLQSIVQAELDKLNPDLSPEAKKIRELEKKVNEAEAKRNAEEIRNYAIVKLTEKSIDPKFVSFLSGETKEEVESKIGELEALIKTTLDNHAKSILKQGGRIPPKGEPGKDGSFALQILKQSQGGRKAPEQNPYF